MAAQSLSFPGGTVSGSPIYWNFSTTGNFEGWIVVNASSSTVLGGTLNIDPAGIDLYIAGPNIAVSAFSYSQVELINRESHACGLGLMGGYRHDGAPIDLDRRKTKGLRGLLQSRPAKKGNKAAVFFVYPVW